MQLLHRIKPINLWLWHLVLVPGSQHGMSKHRVLAGSSFLPSPCPAGFSHGFPAFLEAVLSARQFCLVASLVAWWHLVPPISRGDAVDSISLRSSSHGSWGAESTWALVLHMPDFWVFSEYQELGPDAFGVLGFFFKETAPFVYHKSSPKAVREYLCCPPSSQTTINQPVLPVPAVPYLCKGRSLEISCC